MKNVRHSAEANVRNDRIYALGKWDRFRVNREIVIDRYIAARKI